METGEAAETWLNLRLNTDERWADGVPDDAPPWVAAAFADVAALSIDELLDASEAPDIDTDTTLLLPAPEVDATSTPEHALDDWLGTHQSFEAVDDALDFTVAPNGHAGVDDGLADEDPAAALAAMSSAAVQSPSGLHDPFDGPSPIATVRDSVEDSVDEVNALDVLADDIVRSPHIEQPVDVLEPDENVGSDLQIDGALSDIAVPESAPQVVVDDVTPASHLVADPFDDLDLGPENVDIPAHDASGDVDDGGDDLLDEFGDDGWADD